MAVSIKRVLRGVRTQGTGYLLRAPLNEWRHPRLGVTRTLRGRAAAVGDWLARRRELPSSTPDDQLVFAFDLGCSPITFDFATVLAGAELERRRRGLDGIFVAFVPGAHDDFRRELPDYQAVIDPALRWWRLRNVLVPMLALLPSVRGYAMCPTRDFAERLLPRDAGRIFPETFRTWMPRQPSKRVIHDRARAGDAVWPMFTSTERARRAVSEFLDAACGPRRPLVITLRQSTIAISRNSRVEEWKRFLGGLDRRRFTPIVVHDSEATADVASTVLPGEISCDLARWNLEARMALYEAAWLNLSIMHGPMELCWYNHRTRYVVFLEPGADISSSPDLIAEGGQPLYADLDFATPLQRIVWQPDRAAVIQDAFEEMCGKIEASDTQSTAGQP